jgi:hypothetical protein
LIQEIVFLFPREEICPSKPVLWWSNYYLL